MSIAVAEKLKYYNIHEHGFVADLIRKVKIQFEVYAEMEYEFEPSMAAQETRKKDDELDLLIDGLAGHQKK